MGGGAFAFLIFLSFLFALPALAQRHKDASSLTEKQQFASDDHFMEACKQDVLGNYEAAIFQLEKVLKLEPGSAAANFKLAEVYGKQGKYHLGQPYAAKAVELAPTNPYYVRLEGELYASNNEHDQALKVFQKAIKMLPNEPDLYESLAREQLARGKTDDALKTYDKLQKIIGFDYEIARQKQKIYLKANRLQDAIHESEKLVEANPDEPEHVILLAELLLSNDRVPEAERVLEAHKTLVAGMAEYDLLQYQLYTKKGMDALARESLLAAFKRPELPLDEKMEYLAGFFTKQLSDKDSIYASSLLDAINQAHPEDARAATLNGDFLAGHGRYAEARTAYLKAAKLDGGKFAVWEQIVKLDMQLEQIDSLVRHTDMALEAFPNSGTLWYYNGMAAAVRKENKKAITALERARRLSQSDPPVLRDVNTWLGDLYQGEKDYAKSDMAYGEALQFDSVNVHVLNNWGYYLSLREQNLPLAMHLGKKLIELAPDDPTYLDTYGWILYKSKDLTGAVNYLEKAAKPSSSATIWEHYGDALYKSGKTKEAVDAWKTAQQKTGENSGKLTQKIAEGRLVE